MTEERDQQTNQLLETLYLPSNFKVICTPDCYPRTKGKALNYALNFVDTPVVGIYDAEDIPAIDQPRHAASAFAELGFEYIAVQAKLNFIIAGLIYSPSYLVLNMRNGLGLCYQHFTASNYPYHSVVQAITFVRTTCEQLGHGTLTM